jgi:Cof subfamily protein (haloacid dehalogenase superfamily)
VIDNAGVRLVIADVDGTLLTPDKLLTSRARAAVRALTDAGIRFTITSGRPPQGLTMLIDELRLAEPIAPFNGGMLVEPDLSVIRERPIAAALVHPVQDLLMRHGVDVWVYTDSEWFVRSSHGPHVEHEERAVKVAATVVASFDDVSDRVIKIVGVTDDGGAMSRCSKEMHDTYGRSVSATQSQSYYLDVTHPDANKGEVVSVLSTLLAIPTAEIAAIGDGPNDVLMFERSGVSIAMGNAAPDVQRAARFVTTPNTDDGFAAAMERYVLGGHGRTPGRAEE